jgi:hypothetical protein
MNMNMPLISDVAAGCEYNANITCTVAVHLDFVGLYTHLKSSLRVTICPTVNSEQIVHSQQARMKTRAGHKCFMLHTRFHWLAMMSDTQRAQLFGTSSVCANPPVRPRARASKNGH